jgi:4-amino-4-deoxy-L-arabinose transferase-like glycosyltransferase
LRWERTLTRSRRWLLAAVGALLAGAALTIPVRHLWDPDESRYAEVTREMLASGQMLVPLLHGETYAHKPPLYFWALAATRALGGSWTLAAVLPPLLATLATLLMLPGLAGQLGLGSAAGRLAAALLASTPFAAGMALMGRMDMVLAALHTAALVLLARLLGMTAGRSSSMRAAHYAFWAVVALGVLTKGPVALVLPLGAAAGLWTLNRRAVTLRPLFDGAGPLFFLAAVLAWVIPAALSGGPEYAAELLIRQTAERVVPGTNEHPEPIWFHLATYPLTGLPWSPLVIAAAISALRRRDDRARLFLSVCVVSLVAILSAVAGKLVIYLLPMFPMAALLAADRLGRDDLVVRRCLVAGAAATAAGGIAVAAAPFWQPDLVVAPLLLVPAGLVVFFPAAGAVVLGLRSRAALASVVTTLAAAGLAFSAVALPLLVRVLEPTMSLSGLAAAVVAAEPEAADTVIYQDNYAGLSLYAERRLTVLATPAELGRALRADRWVVIEERDFRKLPEELRAGIAETQRFRHKRRGILLVRAVR